jgi:arsenate reductase
MKTVLFACVHNAGRSQMASGWFNALVDSASATAVSAGTEPAERVHPEVLKAMHEVGIDLSSARAQLLTEQLAKNANLLVTMGCGESCPVVPGVERQDWLLADPKGQSLQRVREIREEIRGRLIELINAKGWKRT